MVRVIRLDLSCRIFFGFTIRICLVRVWVSLEAETNLRAIGPTKRDCCYCLD